jgi:hypothetical protein
VVSASGGGGGCIIQFWMGLHATMRQGRVRASVVQRIASECAQSTQEKDTGAHPTTEQLLQQSSAQTGDVPHVPLVYRALLVEVPSNAAHDYGKMQGAGRAAGSLTRGQEESDRDAQR